MTSMNEREIIAALERASQFELPDAAVERDLHRVRQSVASEYQKRNVWRAIMRSKWTKLTSAAAILVTAAVSLNLFTSRPLSATELLTRVAQNMENLAWSKTTTESYVPGKEEPASVDVHWIDMRNKRVYTVFSGKYIHLWDHVRREHSIYRPETNDMILERLNGEWVSPAGGIREYVEKLEKEGIAVTESQESYKGRPAIVLTFTEVLDYLIPGQPTTKMMMGGKYVRTIRSKWIIDRQDHLLGAAEITYLDGDGNVIVVRKSTSEPVSTGPADIYELGVPRDVKIVNKVPDERVEQMRERITAHRKGFLDTYVAVITEARVEDGQERIIEGMVVFRRSKDLRVDVYRWLYGSTDKVTPLYRNELDASHTRLNAFWPEEDGWGIRSVRLYDGLWQHVLDVQGDKLTARDRQRRPDGDLYADDDVDDFGWRTLWAVDGVEHPFEDDYSRTNGLIATEWTTQAMGSQLPKRQVAYIDPQKDYICHRYTSEELIEAPWQEDKAWIDNVPNKRQLREQSTVREVVEYGRTPAGQWYPRAISEKGYEQSYGAARQDVNRIVRIHLVAERPESPANLFDPKALPRVPE